jgi:hypothetical protein
MVKHDSRSLLHAVIDELPPAELEFVCKLFSSFINDYHDSRLTPEEHDAHMLALHDDEWYDETNTLVKA